MNVGNRTRRAELMIELETTVKIIEQRNSRIKADCKKIAECSKRFDVIWSELATLKVDNLVINPTNEPI